MIEGEEVIFHSFKVAPGYTVGASWIHCSILSNTLELVHGADLNRDYDDNDGYEATLGWSNIGGSIADPYPDSLVLMAVHSDDIPDVSSGAESELREMDYIPLYKEPETVRLVYGGLDATEEDRVPLRYRMHTFEPFEIPAHNGPYDRDENVACQVFAPYIELTVGEAGRFLVDWTEGGAHTASDQRLLIAANGAHCEGDIGDLGNGALLMRGSSSRTNYVYKRYESPHDIEFDLAGAGASWETGGSIRISAFDDSAFASRGPFTGEVPEYVITLVEDAGPEETGFVGRSSVGAWTGYGTDSTFSQELIGSTWERIFGEDGLTYVYAGPVGSSGMLVTVHQNFTTERGSYFDEITDTSVRFLVAERVVYADFHLVPNDGE
jgi:hypothetical protein